MSQESKRISTPDGDIILYYGYTSKGPYAGIAIGNKNNKDYAEISLDVESIKELKSMLDTIDRHVDFFGQ